MKKLFLILVYLFILLPTIVLAENLPDKNLPAFIKQLDIIQKFINKVTDKNKPCHANSIKCLIMKQDTIVLAQYLEMVKNGKNINDLSDEIMPSAQEVLAQNGTIEIARNYTIVRTKNNDGTTNIVYLPKDLDLPQKLDHLRKRNAILRDLFASQANINLPDEYGFTSLHYAAAVDNPYILDLLQQYGAMIYPTNNGFKFKPIHVAVILNSNAVIPKIMNLCGREDFDNERDFSLSVLYSYFGSSVDILENIINFNFQTSTVNSPDKFGNTAIFYSAFVSNKDFLNYLYTKQHADLNMVNSSGKSILSYMAQYNNFEMVDYLIKLGANIHQEDYAKRTAIFYAVKNGNLAMIDLLLNNNASIHLYDRDNLSPLFYAVSKDDVAFMQELAKRNISLLNLKSPNGYNLLNYSLALGKNNIANYLIGLGHNVNDKDSTGLSSLVIAVSKSNYEMVKTLLARGADVNLQSNSGNTALHYAIEIGNDQIIQLLIDSGANYFIQNEDGMTAAGYASLHQRKNILLAIINHNPDFKTLLEAQKYDELSLNLCSYVSQTYHGPCLYNAKAALLAK